MGLRAEKQRRQRQEIIENAIALFRSRGFDGVRVREIARACDLSDATFFNYFNNKEAVLREWAAAQLEASLLPGKPAADAGSLRRAVRAWAAEFARRAEADPKMMGEAWDRVRLAELVLPAAEARGRGPRPSKAADLISAGQDSGLVRGDLDPDTLAGLLRLALAGALAQWLAEPGPAGRLEPLLVRAADLVLDGARKRNERVSPGSIGDAKPRGRG